MSKILLKLCQLVTWVAVHLLTLGSRQTVGTDTSAIRSNESAISTIYSVCAVCWNKRDNFGLMQILLTIIEYMYFLLV